MISRIRLSDSRMNSTCLNTWLRRGVSTTPANWDRLDSTLAAAATTFGALDEHGALLGGCLSVPLYFMRAGPAFLLKLAFCALLCAALVFALGCSERTADPDGEKDGEVTKTELPPDPPGEGVGRIMPVVVPPRPERVSAG